MNDKEEKLYKFRNTLFTGDSIRKEIRENAEFWERINALQEQSRDEITITPYISKNPFMEKYCINVEIQCASSDTQKAAEKIRSTYYYSVPLEVVPSMSKIDDLLDHFPER